MAAEELTVLFKYATLDIELALRIIRDELADRHIPSSGFELYGEPVNLSKVTSSLKNEARDSFNLAGRGFTFQLAQVGNHQVDIFKIKTTAESYQNWEKWTTRLASNSNFIMAWLANVEYQFWQNVEDVLQYDTRSKPHNHLPKKSNGLPYPLEKAIVDVSNNPGRRIFRGGYIEVVGALMWLGKSFWPLTKASKHGVEQTNWLKVVDLLPSVARLEASKSCFTSDKGCVGEIQRKLRTLLFPEEK